ncbi:MAG: N-acetylmuramoyl-L-alanine amidase, family 2, partial [Marmoricola sp.]|nr:N-acetylmuramoyl-L-alanine amidase, family 2 [Marmoricola sp.]
VTKRAVAMPRIYTRAEWGANESLRDQSSPGYGTVEAGFIHHTVNANNYTADQVPALLRGIYAYHTQSRGWRDIGYNYLVDRFGRIWEGRWGGITKAVLGAHTLGYNEVSFAMSAIGNYDITAPSQAVLDAYARLYAWKLSLYGIRADATHLWVKDRYLNAINGHRDVGQTACPGRYLYAKIPYIRTLAQKYQDGAPITSDPAPAPPTPTPTPTPAPSPTSAMTSPTQPPVAWSTQSSGIAFPKVSSLTGTSHPDLVLQRASDGLVRVVPMGGQVGFSAPVTTPAHWSTMNLVSAVGDVTGDGRGDVLARLAKDGTTRVYAGDGQGHVTVPGTTVTNAFRSATAVVTAGDWNRDGRADVLMTDTAGRLLLVPGRGAGLFGTPTVLSSRWSAVRSTAVAGDLTGDGRPDVVALGRDGWLTTYPSTSAGGLGAGTRVRSMGPNVVSIAGGAGDLTGDSTGDLVIRSTSGDSAILAGAGGGRFGDVLGWFQGTVGLTSLTAAPVAGSKQADLVGVSSSGEDLVVLPHNGLRNLLTARPSTLRVPGATQVMGVGDWNGDGNGDLVTREAGGNTLVLRAGRGDGTFAAPVTMATGWKTFTVLAPVGDVTGDRHPDLAGRTATGAMRVFPGNGAHGFLAPRSTPARLKTFNQIGSGSWTPASAGSTLLGSNGGFVPTNGSLGGDPASWNWVLGPGDVDGDGLADLVVRGPGGKLWLLPGTGNGTGPKRLIGSGFAGYRLIG